MTVIAIAVGGALGSLARHAVSEWTQQWFATRFPAGIVIVNLTGCFLVGLFAGLLAADRITMGPPWRHFVFVGLLGGYTTFSTFGLETFLLGRARAMDYALLNVGTQVIGGLLAVWLGYRLGVVGR